MKYFKIFLATMALAGLAACGGGGGSPGSVSGQTTTPSTTVTTTTVAATAADFTLAFDKTSIQNNGLDKVVLTVIALNASRNVIPGLAVEVSVDSGAIFAAKSAVTDASGAFVGDITNPSDKTDRVINVIAKVGGVTKSQKIFISGSQIETTVLPSAPTQGQAVTISFRLTDAAKNPISGKTLSIAGSAGIVGTSTATDQNGLATFVGAAPAIAPPATTADFVISVSGSGITVNNVLRVVSASGIEPPPVTVSIVPGPNAATAVPTNIQANLSSQSANKSRIEFKVLDAANNQGVPNVRVIFKIVPPGLGAGEAMSTGNEIVYTKADGLVSSDYIAGSRTSPTDGVRIRACYGATNAAALACTEFRDATLTVGGQALNVVISSGNKLASAFGGIIYVQSLVVSIGDAAGNPVANATVSASVDVTHFGKGDFGSATQTYQVTGSRPPKIADSYATNLNPSTVPSPAFGRVWCENEDKNRNGTLDSGDDLDGDGILEPRSSEVLVSFVNGNKTDVNGRLELQASWGQNVGTWLAYTVKATTRVEGSEGTNSKPFITEVLQADVPNGAFLTPPYGINNCKTNN